MNWLRNLIARIRGLHNTDDVLSSFHKSLERLEGVIERHSDLADAQASAAKMAENAARAARDEAKKAAAALGRLEAIFRG